MWITTVDCARSLAKRLKDPTYSVSGVLHHASPEEESPTSDFGSELASLGPCPRSFPYLSEAPYDQDTDMAAVL
jgi:hypothetical protein